MNDQPTRYIDDAHRSYHVLGHKEWLLRLCCANVCRKWHDPAISGPYCRFCSGEWKMDQGGMPLAD